MTANDVSKLTHIFSSKSPDQLISARSNKEYIPSKIYIRINRSQNSGHKSPKRGNKPKKIINSLALQCSVIEYYHIYTSLKQATTAN